MAGGLRASLALRRLELNRLEADWLNHADVRVRYPCEGVEDGTGIAELVDTLTTTVHQQLIGSTPESEVLWVVRLSQLGGGRPTARSGSFHGAAAVGVRR